ncbi:MAG TPA: hypothetical protein VH640_31660 [Bryobacteraceae bacterium]|jgi:hypothetical protein
MIGALSRVAPATSLRFRLQSQARTHRCYNTTVAVVATGFRAIPTNRTRFVPYGKFGFGYTRTWLRRRAIPLASMLRRC